MYVVEGHTSYANYYATRCFASFIGFHAVTKALADARLKYSDVEQAVVGYCYGKHLYNYVHNKYCK